MAIYLHFCERLASTAARIMQSTHTIRTLLSNLPLVESEKIGHLGTFQRRLFVLLGPRRQYTGPLLPFLVKLK